MITRESFEKVISPLHNEMLFLATKWCFGDSHKAEDALQDALLKAYTHLNEYQSDNFKGWLYTILRNTILNANRPKKHGWSTRNSNVEGKEVKEVTISDGHQLVSQIVSPLDILCDDEDVRLLNTAIQSLSEQDRQILQDDVDGIPQAIIAKQYNIPRARLTAKLFRIRKVLREYVQKHN